MYVNMVNNEIANVYIGSVSKNPFLFKATRPMKISNEQIVAAATYREIPDYLSKLNKAQY